MVEVVVVVEWGDGVGRGHSERLLRQPRGEERKGPDIFIVLPTYFYRLQGAHRVDGGLKQMERQGGEP